MKDNPYLWCNNRPQAHPQEWCDILIQTYATGIV